MFQRFGTDKVGYTSAPILLIWFSFIAAIGIFNFIKYDPSVIKALNPKYIVDYFKRNKDQAWISLRGVVLAITGIVVVFVMALTSTFLVLRLPGLAIFYSELVHGIPPIFKHYVANVPALHSARRENVPLPTGTT
ncbi:high affinity K+ transporter 5 [Perilla frutescens var. frutescens]|nr:high affinity K+ transporter 5 [Perilla frutescens var. frutescens]